MNEVFHLIVQSSTNDCASLRIKYHNPEELLIQQTPGIEKVGKVEVNRMRTGSITEILTSVDIQEFVKIGRRGIEIYEGT